MCYTVYMWIQGSLMFLKKIFDVFVEFSVLHDCMFCCAYSTHQCIVFMLWASSEPFWLKWSFKLALWFSLSCFPAWRHLAQPVLSPTRWSLSATSLQRSSSLANSAQSSALRISRSLWLSTTWLGSQPQRSCTYIGCVWPCLEILMRLEILWWVNIYIYIYIYYIYGLNYCEVSWNMSLCATFVCIELIEVSWNSVLLCVFNTTPGSSYGTIGRVVHRVVLGS